MSYDPPIGLDQNNFTETVGDAEYNQKVKPFVKFCNRDNSKTNYLFDPFRSSNNIQIEALDVEAGIGDAGSANIRILNDSNIDESLINWGNKVIIKLAKNQWEYTGNPASTFLIGYVKDYTKERPDTGILNHLVQVQGSKILFSERIINCKKSTKSTSNTDFQIKNHIKNIISDPKCYPTTEQTLLQQGGFDLSGIDTNLKTFLGVVNFEVVEAGNAIERLVNIEGARFFIDYQGEREIVTAAFPTELHTGVTIKSGDLKSMSDASRYTGYFRGSWEGQGSISGSTGFANRLFTKTQIEEKEFTSSFENKDSLPLVNRAIAQKFFISETRISDVAFILSKVGDPSSTNNRVNGRIISDDNNSPTGNTISSFNIPLDDIDNEPDTIFVNDLDVKNRFVENAKPAWLVLYQRSGKDDEFHSEPNNDFANCIRWHNNKDITTTTTLVSMQAQSGDREDNLDWKFNTSSTKGPTFCFGVFAKIRHISELSDRGSIGRYGQVDAEVDTSFLEEPLPIQTYLEAQLQYTVKPRIVFGTRSVDIPSYFLYKPYQIVTLVDSLAYPNGIDVEIQRAAYSFDASVDGMGTKTADITPVGYYDYLDENWKC